MPPVFYPAWWSAGTPLALPQAMKNTATAPHIANDSAPILLEAEDAARAAGLHYLRNDTPGITRERAGEEWRYRRPNGTPVRDLPTLQRIKSLAIPPAWTDVWISPDARSHLQATGRDAKGRKQYRYHAEWRATRDETKYNRMIAFGEALPKIRARVEHDLRLHGLPHDKVLATVVRLLETTLIRVGNEEYARENQHYGLTTLQNEHVDVGRNEIRFHFTGKSGVEHSIGLKDPRLARIVGKLRDLPGHELFQYVNEHGERRIIGSADVNAYLHEITGEHFTAKDFRTWAGTVLAAFALREFEAFDSQTQAKKNVVHAIEQVAERLGNTPSVCRKCYVHPSVIDAYLDGTMRDALIAKTEAELSDDLAALKPEEAAVLAFLRERLAATATRGRAGCVDAVTTLRYSYPSPCSWLASVSTARVSTCEVWGKKSNSSSQRTAYPPAMNSARSRASVTGLHET